MFRDLDIEDSSNKLIEESDPDVVELNNDQVDLSKSEQVSIDIDKSSMPATTKTSYAMILKSIAKNFKHPKEVMLPTVIEATVGLAFASADTPFLTKNPTWYYHPFTITSVMILLNFFSRSIKHDESKKSNFNFSIRSFLYGMMDLMNRSVLTHEAGHLTASLCFYQNPNPKITLIPPLDGFTTFNQSNLNELGRIVGDHASRAITSFAGVGTELLFNVAGLTAAHAISDNYPEIKAHLRFAMVLSVFRSAFYALSGAWDCETGRQDFCDLKNNVGISPIAAAFLIVGSIVLLQLCLSCITSCCKKLKHENQPTMEEIVDNDRHEENNETTKLLRR